MHWCWLSLIRCLLLFTTFFYLCPTRPSEMSSWVWYRWTQWNCVKWKETSKLVPSLNDMSIKLVPSHRVLRQFGLGSSIPHDWAFHVVSFTYRKQCWTMAEASTMSNTRWPLRVERLTFNYQEMFCCASIGDWGSTYNIAMLIAAHSTSYCWSRKENYPWSNLHNEADRTVEDGWNRMQLEDTGSLLCVLQHITESLLYTLYDIQLQQ